MRTKARGKIIRARKRTQHVDEEECETEENDRGRRQHKK